ncbi:MAG TPA: glycerol-3-phosphate 1-O-acyltransferase PlsY [Candidatus Limnocylindria bacterium]|jgi:glycerol-3-phosphate acyltransferase PlsY
MGIVLAAVVGYLLGAIPFGLIIGRATKGVDLREHGSHRTGATNALRTLGAPAAAAVFLLDVGKGVAAVLLARLIVPDDPATEWAAAAAGIAAIVGHNWSVFIRFTGGRGVATSAGALGAMSPWTLLVIAPVVVLVIWRSRYVSLGSITGALLAPVVTAGFALAAVVGVPAIVYALVSGLLVTVAHSDNIGRLRAGTERKIGRKEAVPGG